MELPTYTNIWRIEKRLYKLYDFRLPMPLPVGQIAVFTAIAVPYIIILTLLGLPFSHTSFWLYVLPPGVLAWLATRPVLESKRLPELIVSQLRYLGEPRSWCRLAPLAEKDEILVVARVWRRAEEPPPELAAQRQLKPARRGVLASPEPAVATATVATAASPEPVSAAAALAAAGSEPPAANGGAAIPAWATVAIRRSRGAEAKPGRRRPRPAVSRPVGPQPGGHAVPRGAASPGAPAVRRPARGTAARAPGRACSARPPRAPGGTCVGLGAPRATGCTCVGLGPPCDPSCPASNGPACNWPASGGLGPASAPGGDGWHGAACAVVPLPAPRPQPVAPPSVAPKPVTAAPSTPAPVTPAPCGRRSSVRDGDRRPAGRPSRCGSSSARCAGR